MNSQILYEDNHIIIINKKVGQLVQGDKTGDQSLLELLKDFIKERDHKPGNVYLGLVHRIDRPTSGLVIYAKTSKALSRLTQMVKNREIKNVVATMAIEDMYFSEDFLNEIVKISKGEKTFEELRQEVIKKYARF